MILRTLCCSVNLLHDDDDDDDDFDDNNNNINRIFMQDNPSVPSTIINGGLQDVKVNPLSSSIHIQILQTELQTFP